MRLQCTKAANFVNDGQCTNDAKELLLVRMSSDPTSKSPDHFLRCSTHPASDDIKMLQRAYPGVETQVLKL